MFTFLNFSAMVRLVTRKLDFPLFLYYLNNRMTKHWLKFSQMYPYVCPIFLLVGCHHRDG